MNNNIFEQVEVNSERWFDLTPLLNEEFRDIDGFEGKYQISNYGRVLSLLKYNAINKSYYERLKIKKNQIRVNGNYNYWVINLSNQNINKNSSIHRLVAETFIPNPNNLPEVNHIDENPLNNCVNNLEWCDRLYNANYGFGMKTRDIKKSKPIIQYDINGKLRKIFLNSNEINKTTNYKLPNIINCCNGKENYKTAYNSKWEYVKNIEQIIKKYEEKIEKLQTENKKLKEMLKYE